MMKRFLAFTSSLSFAFICLVLACAVFGTVIGHAIPSEMDYVPEGTDGERICPEFIATHTGAVRGLYGNYDVPSYIFRYEAASPEPVAEITRRAIERGWKCVSHEPDRAEFRRWEKHGIAYVVYEAQIRVRGRMVYVGYVPGATEGKVAKAGMAVPNSWGQRVIWPKLGEYTGEGR